MGWNPDRLPDLAGRNYFVTGGNSGLGYEATKILTSKGASVWIGCRNQGKAKVAIAKLQGANPDAKVFFVPIDLSEAESVQTAAELVLEACPTLDAVVNNAGVMQPPLRRTSEGYELQFATNHLGHFRLNRALYPRIRESGGRIVPVSSVAHKMGRIHFSDLQSEKRYDETVAYCQSKLANLMYGLELDRRLRAVGSPVKSIPCHPGYAATNLQSAGVEMDGGNRLLKYFYKISNRVVAQSAVHGSWPLVLAAADPEAKSGTYYGPTWFADSRGPVGESSIARHARDEEVARRLWEVTEQLVGPWEITE